MNAYRLLADLVVVAHALWVGVVVFGMAAIFLGAVLRWRWVRDFYFRIIHLAMITLVVFETLFGIACPLTVWENDLRKMAGETVEEGTFIGRIANAAIFYDLPHSHWAFALVYCLFGAVVLATLFLVPPRWPPWWPFRRTSN